jgi:hypothetical protein
MKRLDPKNVTLIGRFFEISLRLGRRATASAELSARPAWLGHVASAVCNSASSRVVTEFGEAKLSHYLQTMKLVASPRPRHRSRFVKCKK